MSNAAITLLHARSYRPKQAAELLGISPATLWRWINEKRKEGFPQPKRLSPRCTVLDGAELIAWRDAQGKGGTQ